MLAKYLIEILQAAVDKEEDCRVYADGSHGVSIITRVAEDSDGDILLAFDEG